MLLNVSPVDRVLPVHVVPAALRPRVRRVVRLHPRRQLQRRLRPQQEQERRHSPSRAGAGHQVTPH